MCTVTYLPLENDAFILTSNRDEQPSRATLAPKTYEEDGVLLTYPKDVVAGGTWIGTSSRKRLVCLLNGGYEAHQRAAVYAKSRGLVVKELLKVVDVASYIDEVNFEGMEPFTIVLVDWRTSLNTFELVWDGVVRYFNKLEQVPKIWSSSVLYSKEERELRMLWFDAWLAAQQGFSQEEILRFHSNSTKGTPTSALKMKRSVVETVSVTSVVKIENRAKMTYQSFV